MLKRVWNEQLNRVRQYTIRGNIWKEFSESKKDPKMCRTDFAPFSTLTLHLEKCFYGRPFVCNLLSTRDDDYHMLSVKNVLTAFFVYGMFCSLWCFLDLDSLENGVPILLADKRIRLQLKYIELLPWDIKSYSNPIWPLHDIFLKITKRYIGLFA